MDGWTAQETGRRAQWHDYYGRKRIRHQNLQLELIGLTPARRILEVGPHLGYVTALLDNAGYEVTTLDIGPAAFRRPAVPHLEMDLTAPDAARLAGFDLILCCETLEHIQRPQAEAVLRAFHDAGAPWLLLSVPYSGLLFHAELLLTPHGARGSAFLKWKEALTRFVPWADPLGHKWELGTPGYPLRGWETALAAAGWRIEKRVMSAPTRAAFHLCRRAESPA